MSKYLDKFIENDHIQGYRGGMIYPCFVGRHVYSFSHLLFESKDKQRSVYFDFSKKWFEEDDTEGIIHNYTDFRIKPNTTKLKLSSRLPQINADSNYRALYLVKNKMFCLFYDGLSKKSYVFNLFSEPDAQFCLLIDTNPQSLYSPKFSIEWND